MAYLVLARKYRPQRFAEMVGQDHITQLLEKAIGSKRIAHAFLFCGPRGVGKTSCARILAKSLNCQDGPTLNPCGECPPCREITQANSFDVLEIDGASNRGIDEIRTLRDNVKFAPGYGRYKIYIVDEVHMLTSEAFNALLKTLEEPPDHVKFILATTAPSKVPSTIISRCQRFDFKRMPITCLQDQLKAICAKENLPIEEDALFAIAKAGQGSMRDALSILDQLSALSGRKIAGEDVYSMLGMVEMEFLFELADALASQDCPKVLEIFDRTIAQGKDIKQLNRDLIEHFRHLMVIKIGGKALGKMVDYPVAAKERLLAQTEKFSLARIIESIEAFIEAQETARVTGFERMPLEMAFAKLTCRSEISWGKPALHSPPKTDTVQSSGSAERKNLPKDVTPNQKPPMGFSPQSTISASPVGIASTDPLATANETILNLEKVKSLWNAIGHALSREKMSLATYLQEGNPSEVNGNKITIGFSQDHVFQKESLEEKNALRLIERIFAEKLATAVRVELKIVENYQPAEEEPLVKQALETFKGKVINKWHNSSG